jgi:hypothetical protein
MIRALFCLGTELSLMMAASSTYLSVSLCAAENQDRKITKSLDRRLQVGQGGET